MSNGAVTGQVLDENGAAQAGLIVGAYDTDGLFGDRLLANTTNSSDPLFADYARTEIERAGLGLQVHCLLPGLTRAPSSDARPSRLSPTTPPASRPSCRPPTRLPRGRRWWSRVKWMRP